ncbi:hypothetical protein, partial [Shewanella algae]|uniref:hypothetical protein n=1 Tax=Shewanella algae TaxID=38313 RepID=UPI00313EB274
MRAPDTMCKPPWAFVLRVTASFPVATKFTTPFCDNSEALDTVVKDPVTGTLMFPTTLTVAEPDRVTLIAD